MLDLQENPSLNYKINITPFYLKKELTLARGLLPWLHGVVMWEDGVATPPPALPRTHHSLAQHMPPNQPLQITAAVSEREGRRWRKGGVKENE